MLVVFDFCIYGLIRLLKRSVWPSSVKMDILLSQNIEWFIILINKTLCTLQISLYKFVHAIYISLDQSETT